MFIEMSEDAKPKTSRAPSIRIKTLRTQGIKNNDF